MRSPCRLSWGRRLAPRGTAQAGFVCERGFRSVPEGFPKENKSKRGSEASDGPIQEPVVKM